MKRKITFGIAIGILSLVVDGLAGLVLIPILLHYLSAKLTGIWILLTSFGSFLNLAQAGLGPVVVRMAAEVKGKPGKEEFSELISLVRYSYRIVLLLVLFVSGLIYSFYIHSVLISIDYIDIGLIVWIMLSVGYALRLYSMKNINLINGFGELGWDKVLQILITVTSNIGFFIVLYLGKGLIGLGIVFLITSFCYWLGSTILIKCFIKEGNVKLDLRVERNKAVQLFKQSSQIFILNIIGFLIMNTDVFIIERLFGVEVLPLYSALVKVIFLIIASSTLIHQMLYPYIALNWTQSNYKKCFELYKKGIFYSVGMGLLMSIFALMLAPIIVPMWLGKGGYLGISVFGPLLLFGLIYIHHSAHSNPVIATGTKAFTVPAILNACLSIPLSIIGGKMFGIPGVVLGNIIATIIPSIYVVSWSYRFLKSCNIRRA